MVAAILIFGRSGGDDDEGLALIEDLDEAPEVAWTYQGDTDEGVWSFVMLPVVDDDKALLNAYYDDSVLLESPTLPLLDLESGEPIWEVDAEVLPEVTAEDTVPVRGQYFEDNDFILVSPWDSLDSTTPIALLDPADGSVLSTATLEGELTGAFEHDGDAILTLAGDPSGIDRLERVDAENFEEVQWSAGLPDSDVFGEGIVEGGQGLGGGQEYYAFSWQGSASPIAYYVDLDSGEVHSAEEFHPLLGELDELADEGTSYDAAAGTVFRYQATEEGAEVMALDDNQGELWDEPLPVDPELQHIALELQEEAALFRLPDGRLDRVDPETGESMWDAPVDAGESSQVTIAASNDIERTIVRGDDGILILDTDTGETVFEIPRVEPEDGGYSSGGQTFRGQDNIYHDDDQGTLTAYDEQGEELWQYEYQDSDSSSYSRIQQVGGRLAVFSPEEKTLQLLE